jgi:hypothetical protein
VLIEEARGETTRTLRDGTEIQRVLAERHGAQRASLGWSASDHARELVILREEIAAALRDAHASGEERANDADEADEADAWSGALDVVARLLAHVERAGERSRRSAAT